MVNEKLVEYIKTNLAKGHSLEEIREFVSKHEWSGEDFDEALMKASGSKEGPPPKGQQPPAPGTAGAPPAPPAGSPQEQAPVKKKGHKKLIVGVIVLIIVALLLFYTIADVVSYFEGLYPATLLPE